MEEVELDQTLRDSVTGLVSALGGIDYSQPDHPYVLGDDALGCLKDLKKWVKFYGSSGKLDALRCIADTNLVSLDLCQILGRFKEGQEHDKLKWRVALNCLELLVQLTWQIELSPHRQTEQVQYKYETSLKSAQIGYKNALLHHPQHNILRPVVRIALPSMAVPRRDRPERDEQIIALVISLLRNLVEISSRVAEASGIDRQKNENSRSETILAFEKSDIFTLLTALASGTTDEYEKVDCLLLETLYHLVKGVNCNDLFATTLEMRSKPLDDLSNMLRKEEDIKRQNKRFASTRHNRFGTMISVVKENELRLTVAGQTTLHKDEAHTLEKLDAAKKFVNKQKTVEANDLAKPVQLTNDARIIFRNFVISFLDSSFNSLSASVVRAIERESPRCHDAHRHQLLYVIGWFLRAHSVSHAKGPKVPDQIDYGNVASVFDRRCLVIVLRIMRDASDHKNWTELHAAMECFEELLKAVQTMWLGKSEEYNEIADNILLNLFYDESNLDLIAHIVRSYKRQSFGYLDACTSLAHTVLKLLEQYSQDHHVYVKSKRQRKKTQKDATSGGESESEDDRPKAKSVAEKAFQFTAFEMKFVNDHCIDTYRSLLSHYAELRPDQIKRVLVYFHRIFVKRKQQVILYRLDICELLSRMVHDEISIPKGSSIRTHLEDFVTHYTYTMTKALTKSPILYVELLFSKIPATIYYLQHGEEKVKSEPKRPRPAAELEVRPGRSREDQIAVVVACLLDEQKSDALDSVKTIFNQVLLELRVWEQAEMGRKMLEDMEEARPEDGQNLARPDVRLDFGSDDMKMAFFKDGKLQLLLKLMGAERVGERDDPQAHWIISTITTVDDLETNLRFLKQYIDEPPTFEDGESAEKLLRRKAPAKSAMESDSDNDGMSDTSDSNDSDSSAKPRKPMKKRKRRRADDSELEARRERRRLADLEKRAMIKSAARILDSDDDEEADREFFERERQLRERMAVKSLGGVLPQHGTKRARKKRKMEEVEIISIGRSEEEDTAISARNSPLPSQGSEDTDDGIDKLGSKRRRKVRRALNISSDD